MQIRLRPASVQDIPEMQSLFEFTIRNSCTNDYGPEQIEIWTSSINSLQRWVDLVNDQYCLIAEIDAEMVGFASLKNGNYIDFFYVHASHQRKGIADLLLAKLKAESLRLGTPFMTSDVSITARPFFEKRGFRIIKKNRNLRGGVEIINFNMSEEVVND